MNKYQVDMWLGRDRDSDGYIQTYDFNFETDLELLLFLFSRFDTGYVLEEPLTFNEMYDDYSNHYDVSDYYEAIMSIRKEEQEIANLGIDPDAIELEE